MITTWLKTLQYARQVRGYQKVPETSFVARQGGDQSDMYRISWNGDSKISLQDFHAAFLTSPLFQIELFLMSMVSRANTMHRNHLDAVARGEEISFGPWTMAASEGDDSVRMGRSSSDTHISATKIMQCQVHGQPFCDTWWTVEQSDDSVDLVFGTDIQRYCEGDRAKSTLVFILNPFHSLYSRFLLASAKANLVERKQTHDD